jgi:mono/diheme cytochrome c family protein
MGLAKQSRARGWPRAVPAAIVAGALLASGASIAQDAAEPEPNLVVGPGMQLTQQRCMLCHSVTYITRSRLTLDEWRDTTQRMVRLGAVVTPAEIETIVGYLYTFYGRNPDGTPRARPAGTSTTADTRAR